MFCMALRNASWNFSYFFFSFFFSFWYQKLNTGPCVFQAGTVCAKLYFQPIFFPLFWCWRSNPRPFS